MPSLKIPELICPAGSLPALRAAVDHGADAVYMGYKNDTNARNFAGLNFDQKAMNEGIRYAHARGKQVLMAINTFAQPGREADWNETRAPRCSGAQPAERSASCAHLLRR